MKGGKERESGGEGRKEDGIRVCRLAWNEPK